MAASAPVISASRLKTIAACERKYAGQYLFGLKEEQGSGAKFGEDFHKAAEIYQLTGVIPAPETAIGKLLRSGAHFLRKPGSGALIEYEHRGELPDGTPYVAFIDASDAAPSFEILSVDTFQVDDQKTTSAAERALTDAALLEDMQAMFYAWIVFTPHWYAERMPYGFQGPQQWREWVPPKNLRAVALRWNYFLTRGSPKAWQAKAFAKLDACQRFMAERIMPLVGRIRALHDARAAGVLAEVNHAERDLHGCDGVGTWCGAADACDFNAGGLVALRRNKESKQPMGLAELRAKYGQKTAAAPAPVAPPAPEPVVEEPDLVEAEAEEVEETPPPKPAPAAPAARTRKARVAPPAEPPAPEGDRINPPEAVQALAEIRAEVANDNATPAAQPAPVEFPQLTVQQASTLSTDVLVGALCLRGYTVTITQSKYEAA